MVSKSRTLRNPALLAWQTVPQNPTLSPNSQHPQSILKSSALPSCLPYSSSRNADPSTALPGAFAALRSDGSVVTWGSLNGFWLMEVSCGA